MSDRAKRAVFFDAGDTLFEVKGGVGAVYSRFARKYGVEADPGDLERRFRSVFKKSPPLAFPGARDSEIEALERGWWRDLVRSVFDQTPLEDFDRFFDEIYLFFEGAEGWSLFPETKGVLEKLEESRYHIGIISNFDSRLKEVLRSLGISRFFKTITLSSRHGAAKPSPEIFRIALREAGLSPSEAIYVGDSPHHDIEGARVIGMTPLLIDRTGRYKEEADLPRIADLRALFRYI